MVKYDYDFIYEISTGQNRYQIRVHKNIPGDSYSRATLLVIYPTRTPPKMHPAHDWQSIHSYLYTWVATPTNPSQMPHIKSLIRGSYIPVIWITKSGISQLAVSKKNSCHHSTFGRLPNPHVNEELRKWVTNVTNSAAPPARPCQQYQGFPLDVSIK